MGPMPVAKARFLHKEVTFLGIDLSDGLILALKHDDMDTDILSALQFSPSSRRSYPIIIVKPPSEAGDLRQPSDQTPPLAICLLPHYLEMVLPMVEGIVDELSGSAIVLLVNLSQVPSLAEHRSARFSGDLDEFHSVAFRDTFIRLVRRSLDSKFAIIAVDQEDLLGQKNSAFLRRLFFRNS